MVIYGESCKNDSDCNSNICQYSGAFNERKCVIQEPKYGKPCNVNRDCDSNRCTKVYDINSNFVGRKCVVINNLNIPKSRDMNMEPDPDDSYFMNSPGVKEELDQGLILNKTQKNMALEGKGILADLLIIGFEFVVLLWQLTLDLLKWIFKTILLLTSMIFSQASPDVFFGFAKKYRKNGKCDPVKSISISVNTVNIILTFLFPPLGVFFSRGLNGIGHVIVTGFLTTFFYIPGLIYGLDIVNETICPTSIICYSRKDYSGERYIFSYGDYNLKNSAKMNALKKCMKSMSKGGGLENFSAIQSMKLGEKVEVILYADDTFETEIATVSQSTKYILDFFQNEENDKYIHKQCEYKLGVKTDMPKIMAISIRLKEPEEIKPKQVDPNSVVLYLLNDFRGKYIVLKEGDYDHLELGSLFNDRVSSLRIGENMVIKLFEDANYNRKKWLNYTTGFGDTGGAVFLRTGGDEEILDGQTVYDGADAKPGEIKNLMSRCFYDKASCIRIRPKIEGVKNENLFEELNLNEKDDIDVSEAIRNRLGVSDDCKKKPIKK